MGWQDLHGRQHIVRAWSAEPRVQLGALSTVFIGVNCSHCHEAAVLQFWPDCCLRDAQWIHPCRIVLYMDDPTCCHSTHAVSCMSLLCSPTHRQCIPYGQVHV